MEDTVNLSVSLEFIFSFAKVDICWCDFDA